MTDVSELIERVAAVLRHEIKPLRVVESRIAARAAIEASGVQSLSERNAVLEGALEHCRSIACDYMLNERAARSKITTLVSKALTKEGIENG